MFLNSIPEYLLSLENLEFTFSEKEKKNVNASLQLASINTRDAKV